MPANDVGPLAAPLPAPDRDDEGKPCDDASRPKSDERLTAVFAALAACDLAAVSYTHLTLPTTD